MTDGLFLRCLECTAQVQEQVSWYDGSRDICMSLNRYQTGIGMPLFSSGPVTGVLEEKKEKGKLFTLARGGQSNKDGQSGREHRNGKRRGGRDEGGVWREYNTIQSLYAGKSKGSGGGRRGPARRASRGGPSGEAFAANKAAYRTTLRLTGTFSAYLVYLT